MKFFYALPLFGFAKKEVPFFYEHADTEGKTGFTYKKKFLFTNLCVSKEKREIKFENET